jgi:hypothetical protein
VQNIVNNDFSEIVIENMKQKYKETAPDMDWLVMDVMDMKELPDASFDVAIDKGAAPPAAVPCGIPTTLTHPPYALRSDQAPWMPSWYDSLRLAC